MELAAGAATVGSGLAGSRRRVGGARGGGVLDSIRAAPAWRGTEGDEAWTWPRRVIVDVVLGDGAKLDVVMAPSVVLADASWRGWRDVRGRWGASFGAVQL